MGSHILRGFIIACFSEAQKISQLQDKLAEDGGFEIRPYFSTCNNKTQVDSHTINVHATHIEVLEMCDNLGWAPCVVFEADAIYSGNLYSSLLLAMKENDHWDLMTMGITVLDMQRFMKTTGWSNWPRKAHSMQISGTGGGCHAYMASNPKMFAAFMRLRNVKWPFKGVPDTPCIEYIFNKNITIILPTNIPVIQSNKLYREGFAWIVDSKSNIRYQYWSDSLIDQIVDMPLLFSVLFMTLGYCYVQVSRYKQSTTRKFTVD